MHVVTVSDQIKRAFAETLLERCGRFNVQLHTAREGVVLPDHLDGKVLLDIWPTAHPTPIPDLVLNDHGLTATLSFDRTPFHCTVPWSAVAVIGWNDLGLLDSSNLADPKPTPKPPLRAV